MASLKKFENNPQKQLLDEISGARCVMLGSPRDGEHMQPMAPQIDDAMIDGVSDRIYFFSDNTSDLGKAVLAESGRMERTPLMMTYMGKDYQACVRGTLLPTTDPELIERFWNPIAASWYPEGQTDPKMLMLEFVMQDAQVWASTGNPVKFIYETIKANVTDSLPDVGKSKHVALG